jgi:hypothetical protein
VLNTLARYVWYGGFTNGTTSSPAISSGVEAATHGRQSSRNARIIFDRGSFGLNELNSNLLTLQDFVKWSRELVNTNPESFELSREADDCGAIVVQGTGVYEIAFTFFVPPDIHKPTVQLRVSGKPILSTIDGQMYVVYLLCLYSLGTQFIIRSKCGTLQ